MANKIILKRSSVEGKSPSAIDLEYGELALNYADGKIYFKKSDNTIQTFNAGGSVSSVAVQSTDLSVSGSPITASGEISLSLNTVPVEKGGTGQTTANDAFNALAPDQTGNSGKYLTTDGSSASWTSIDSTYINTTLGYTPMNPAGATMTGALTLSGTPTTALHAATKQYVDDVASGLIVLASCRTATTSNLSATYSNGTNGVGATLTGTGALPSISSVSLSVGDRVLVKDQTAELENGIYVVTTTSGNWVLTRSSDFDDSANGEVIYGSTVYIVEGDLNGTQWVLITPATVTVGTTAIVWTQFGGPSTYTTGAGINITNNTISNTGVTQLSSGSNISVSAETGDITIAFSGTLPVANGGTGATSAEVARSNLSAAASGANSDITSLGGLTTALSIAQGGTGQTTGNAALNALLPSQTTNSGEYLTTNGTDTSWSSISMPYTLYVATSGNDSIADGSITKPFATISAALTYANNTYPVTAGNAQRVAINITPGSYTENINLTRPCTHLFGVEGKLKSVQINGSITVDPSISYGGIFQTNFSLNDLFINSTASHAVQLAGTIQCSLDINNCYLYTSGNGVKAFVVSSTASGGNRIRISGTDITTVGDSMALDISNTTNCVVTNGIFSSASTTDVIKVSGTITLSLIQASTATATNVVNVASGTLSCGMSAFSNTKANGNGVYIAAGAYYIAGQVTSNIALGTGKAVTGVAGSVYLRGGNYFLYGTNNGIGASVTALANSGEVAGTDINSTVPTSVGGTGLTTFGAANRALYSTSASAVTAGTLPIAAGGTGLTTLGAANRALYSTSASAVTAGTLPIAAGGTGATSLSSGYIKSDGTALSSSSTVSGADVSGAVAQATTVANTGAVTTNSDFYVPFMQNNTTDAQGTNTSQNLKYNPSTGTVTAPALSVNQGNFSSATLITTNTTANQIVDSVDGTIYRTAKYVIQVTSGSSYQTSEILIIHDGSVAYYTEFATISTGDNLATFSANYTNGALQLRVTPVNAVTTIRAIRTCINV